VSGASVTLTWGADKTSVDFSVRVLNGGAWSQSASTLTATLANYGSTIRSAPSGDNALTLTTPTAAPSAGVATLAVVKTYPNTLDLGSL